MVKALDSTPSFPVLDATEQGLLNQLAGAWEAERRVTVLETMNMATDVSPTTIHRRLKSLAKKGLIQLNMDEQDNRVKYVMPTPLATAYFAELSNCLLAAAKAADSS